MTSRSGTESVSNRTILYFAGFDPRGASAYHAMTSEQFEKHCALNDLEAEVGRRERVSKTCHRWTFDAAGTDTRVATDFQFLVWDDLVRAHWIRPDWRALLSGAWAFFALSRLGVLTHMLRTSRPIALTMAGPLIQLALLALCALLAFVSIVGVLMGSLIAGIICLSVAVALIVLLPKFMSGFNAPWIGRITSFALASSSKPTFENWEHREILSQRVVDALQGNACDEVLIISHSIGTQIGLIALADALVSNPKIVDEAIAANRLVFITLGQTVPLMSRISRPVTEALKIVGESRVRWLDVSSPADPACYVMVDPYWNQFESKPRVHLENARFFRAYGEETYKIARADRFTMHFLYLMTPDAMDEDDRKAGFDLYRLMTLTDRLADRLSGDPVDVQPFYARAR